MISDPIHASLARLQRLGRDVHAIVNAPMTFSRVDPHYPTLSASFIAPDMQAQEPTWLNKTADFWICRVRYSVWAHTTSAMSRMVDNGGGMQLGGSGGATLAYFDFRWNMKRNKSQAWYGSASGLEQGGSGNMLGRSSLGNQETNEPLTFEKPWKIPQGDGIAFRIQPIRYNGAAFAELNYSRFTVHATFDGFWGIK